MHQDELSRATTAAGRPGPSCSCWIIDGEPENECQGEAVGLPPWILAAYGLSLPPDLFGE